LGNRYAEKHVISFSKIWCEKEDKGTAVLYHLFTLEGKFVSGFTLSVISHAAQSSLELSTRRQSQLLFVPVFSQGLYL